MLIAAAGSLPTSARPGPTRWIAPASGPPTASTETSPDGSGTTQPSGPPRLITQPSLTGASASVSRCHIRWQSTYSGAPEDSRGAERPRANRSSSAATAVIGVAGSASITTSADCRAAGETTVTASRMMTPEARNTGADRPATLLHECGARPVQ